jgi:hypothetical protein
VDVASLLDWDLETQVYPIVRWLVHHRRGKVVDMVHRGLKTVFALPYWIEAPYVPTPFVRQMSPYDLFSLKNLAREFRTAFPDPSIPSLPQLLATISGASSNHFYAMVVKSKDRIPMFYDVIRWMLQRDLLVTLHLRVRIAVPGALKARVHRRWEELRETGWQTEEEDRFRERGHKARTDSVGSDGDFGLFDSPGWYTRRGPGSQSNVANMGEVIGPPILEEGIQLDEEMEEEEEEEEEEEVAPAEAEAAGRMEDSDETEEDYEDTETSILADPGRATSVQRRWLQAMSEGKDEQVTKRFDQYVTVSCVDSFGLTNRYVGSTNTLTVNARMKRSCSRPKYLGGNCERYYMFMTNTWVLAIGNSLRSLTWDYSYRHSCSHHNDGSF